MTYPVVIVKFQGIKCRALLDTGSGSSYASAATLDRISSGKRKERSLRREVELVLIDISDVKFSMPVEVTSR